MPTWNLRVSPHLEIGDTPLVMELDKLKRGHTGIGQVLNSMSGVLIRERHTESQKEGGSRWKQVQAKAPSFHLHMYQFAACVSF